MIAEGHTRGETLSLLRRQTGDVTGYLPTALAPLGVKFERMLVAAQIRVPTSRILLILATAPLALFLAIVFAIIISGGAIGFGRILIIGAFAVSLGLGIPLMFLQVKANRTRRKMQEQFPVALDVFVRGLRAGHPIAAALDLLTVEMPDPIGSQFGLVVDEVTYGADLRDALQAMADRWDMEEMRMFVVSLSIQTETGGNLAEILENLSKVIRERASMMMKVRALVERGPDDRDHAHDPAGLRICDAVHVQPEILPRRVRRSCVRARVCGPYPALRGWVRHDPQNGRFEGLGDDRADIRQFDPQGRDAPRSCSFSSPPRPISCAVGALGASIRSQPAGRPLGRGQPQDMISGSLRSQNAESAWLKLVNTIERAGLSLVDTKDDNLRRRLDQRRLHGALCAPRLHACPAGAGDRLCRC